MSARNLDSFERYAMSAFPLILGVAIVTKHREVDQAVLALSAAGLVGYSVLGVPRRLGAVAAGREGSAVRPYPPVHCIP